MIGIVIVTHRQLGDALIEAAEFIIGKRPEALVSVTIDLNCFHNRNIILSPIFQLLGSCNF